MIAIEERRTGAGAADGGVDFAVEPFDVGDVDEPSDADLDESSRQETRRRSVASAVGRAPCADVPAFDSSPIPPMRRRLLPQSRVNERLSRRRGIRAPA